MVHDVQVFLAGTNQTSTVEVDSIVINEYNNETMNTATFRYWGSQAWLSRLAYVSILSAGGTVYEFSGRLTNWKVTHDRTPQGRVIWEITASAWEYDLGGLLVTARYEAVSATTIATALAARAPSPFTAIIATLLPSVTIAFKMTPLIDALWALAEKIDGILRIDTAREILFDLASNAPAAASLNAANPDWKTVEWAADASQYANVSAVSGMATTVSGDVAIAATEIPVDSVGPFNDTGGLALTNDGVVTYTGRTIATVPDSPDPDGYFAAHYYGPWADPVSNCSDNGAGVVTVVTTAARVGAYAVGDTIHIIGNGASASGIWTVYSITNSTTLVFHRSVDTNSSVGGGMMRRCIGGKSFVTRAGVCTVTTDTAHGFVQGMTVAIYSVAGGLGFEGLVTIGKVIDGTNFTFPQSGHPKDFVETYPFAAIYPATAGGLLPGYYKYRVSYTSPSGETAAGTPGSAIIVPAVIPLSAANTLLLGSGGGGNLFQFNRYTYGFTAVTSRGGETSIGATSYIDLTSGQNCVLVYPTWINWMDELVVAINVYRSPLGGSGALGYVGTISKNYMTVSGVPFFTDNVSDANRGGPPPTDNTATGAAFHWGLATQSKLTARLYRGFHASDPAAIADYKLAVSMSDDTSTTALDTTAPDNLGAAAPETSTFKAPGSLTGVSGVATALKSGEAIAVYWETSDAGEIAATGVTRATYEAATELTDAEVRARVATRLAVYMPLRVAGGYTTEDGNAHAGSKVLLSMASEWGIASTTYWIQSVRIWVDPERAVLQRTVSFGTPTEKDLIRVLHALHRRVS